MPSTDKKDKRVPKSKTLAGYKNITIIATILREEKGS